MSKLPDLEPIAGVSVAINLAYLNLERFRYREKIRSHAKGVMKIFGDSPAPTHIQGMLVYKVVNRLANLEDFDDGLPMNGSAQATKKSLKIDMPWWGRYQWLFERHLDRYIAVAATALSSAVLFIGVAQQIGHLNAVNCIFGQDYIFLSFYLMLAAFVAPIMLAWSGNKIVKQATSKASQCIADCEAALQREPQTVGLTPAIASFGLGRV